MDSGAVGRADRPPHQTHSLAGASFSIEHGMIAEHWDVIEEITLEETWVNSGKF